ncbi:MAG: GNAT family N-acetyltransferase [Planctomycetota bacterium]|jgi:predicted acetyltransferase
MSYEYGPASGDAECREHGRDMAEAFATQESGSEDWLVKQGAEALRILRHNGEKVAGLLRYDFGQYFGGRNVPAIGMAAVIAPTVHRGKGHGHEIMLRALQEIHAEGIGLVPLYAAAPKLYQNLGWALSGSHVRWRISMADIHVSESSAEVRRWDNDQETLKQVYTQVAQDSPSWLARSDGYWQRILTAQPGGNPIYVYVTYEENKPTGYVVFQHYRDANVIRLWLQLKDFQFTTPDAANALFKLIKSFSSTSDEVLFSRGTDDPMFNWMSPKAQNADFSFSWYQRIAHVQNALEARGYAKSLRGHLSLRVKDEHLPDNAGAYRIDIEDGSATVQRIDSSETEINVGGLASLYCGRHSPTQLRRLGLLRGNISGDETLALLFAGPQPSLPDFF